MKKPPVTSGYREINRPLDFVCLGQMRRGLKRSVPPELDFVSSQTILFVLTSSETIRNKQKHRTSIQCFCLYILEETVKTNIYEYLFLPQSRQHYPSEVDFKRGLASCIEVYNT